MGWPKLPKEEEKKLRDSAMEHVWLRVGEDNELSVEDAGDSLRDEWIRWNLPPGTTLSPPLMAMVGFYMCYIVAQAVEKSKKKWKDTLDSDEDMTLGALKKAYDEEVASYRIRGRNTPVIKLVGDMTLGEWRIILNQFSDSKDAARKREKRVLKIIEKMEEKGAAEDTRLRDVDEEKEVASASGGTDSAIDAAYERYVAKKRKERER